MDYLTCEQVADIAKCSIYHVREAVKDGLLKAYKPGKSYVIARDDAAKWIESHIVTPRTK